MQFDVVHPVIPGGMHTEIPRFVQVEQRFKNDEVHDLGAATEAAMRILAAPVAGMHVAIAVGSRGIWKEAEIVHAIARELQRRGARPFVVPAMGSHGGANAVGQLAVLESYGITESSIGIPIRSSMDTVTVGRLDDGTPLHMDRFAFEADGIVLLNKIKPHTAFKAPVESGLTKMLVIGLGKHDGARSMHRHSFDRFPELLQAAAAQLLNKTRVLCGVALIENAKGTIAQVHGVLPSELMTKEAMLLAEAKQQMGRLLIPEIDLLIVDRIGKDINGAGMDPNVTGRSSTHAAGFATTKIDKILVRGLTVAAKGNAAGIGNADFTTRRCFSQIDFDAMYTNVFSARVMQGAKIPVVMPNDRDAIMAAILTTNRDIGSPPRIVRIPDTKHLDRILVSEAVLDELKETAFLRPIRAAQPLRFDNDGYLLD